MDLYLAIVIFCITYFFIILEKSPITYSALIGGFSMVLFNILSTNAAYQSIEFEVIFLLIGMMIIVEVFSITGFFEWSAIKIAQVVKGNPLLLLFFLSLITAVLSAFLANITVILLIVPITLLLTEVLQLNPIPYILSEIFASNIGGASTYIGDPPNIIIGVASQLSFNDFIINLFPINALIFIVTTLTLWLFFRKSFKISRDLQIKIMQMDASRAIKNKGVLQKTIVIFLLMLLGFFTSDYTGYSASIIAFTASIILLLLIKIEPNKIFSKLEWGSLFFFIGLFILVRGLVEVGLIKIIAQKMLQLTGGNLKITSMFILWFSAIVSSFIDNIPYTATLAPMIKNEIIPFFVKSFPNLSFAQISNAFWWSLSLGACLGGNGTLVGASSNIIGVNLLARSGYKISFFKFTLYGMIILLESMILSSLYIWIRYLS